MNICCNFCSKWLMVVFTLMLAFGSLQAQSQPSCDLSKCSPAERALCAQKCSGSATLSTSLLGLLGINPVAQKANCNPVKCNPADCEKVNTAGAKLVATQVSKAPNYSNSLETTTTSEASVGKKKCDALKCSKAKASL